jgi:iron complex outermembrane receptor protein
MRLRSNTPIRTILFGGVAALAAAGAAQGAQPAAATGTGTQAAQLTATAATAASAVVPPNASASTGATEVEELVVLARNREENLQKVPESEVALSAKDIERRNVTQIHDVLSVTPNVSIVSAQDPGLAMISMRGISQVRNGEPPVAFVVDGVPLLSADSFSQALYDIQRIEVLKGPQGAYYGRDAIGGAIVITTKAPTNDFQGYLRGGYGNGDDTLLQGSVRGPIIQDKLLFSLDATDEHFGGVLKSSVLTEDGKPKRVDWKGEQNVRGRVIAHLTDTITADLRAGYGQLDAGASYYIPTNDPNDTTTPIQNDELGYSHRRLADASLKLDDDLGFAKLTSITSWSDTKLFLHEDLDWTPASILGADQARETRGETQEVRLTSRSKQRLRWMVGAYSLWQDRIVNTDLLVTVDPATPLGLHIPVQATSERGTDIAVFGQVNYDITPDLELTGALRWDREARRQTDHLTANQVEADWPKLQPKLSLAYHWTPDVFVYATYGVGFRSGGFNAPGSVFPATYKAETATNYEAGVKTTLWKKRLKLNGAVFYNDLDNYQVFALSQALQGLFNVDKSHMTGVELESQAKITDNFRLDAGLGYIDSRIDGYVLKGAGFESSVPVIPSKIVGNALPLTYKWSGSVAGEYRRGFTLGGDPLTGVFRLEWSGRAGNYWAIDNLDKEKPRSIWDATVRLEEARWALAFWARNLTDEKYTEEFFPKQWCCAFSGVRWPGEPRRFGVTLTRSF